MTARFFLDTNILIHANDQADVAKLRRARALLEVAGRTRHGCLSTQVLQEFFVAATRKLGVPWEVARAQVVRFRELDVVNVTPDLIVEAIDLHRTHALSFWDALVVRAASSAGCTKLYSEDMSDGQVIDGVRMIDPFKHAEA